MPPTCQSKGDFEHDSAVLTLINTLVQLSELPRPNVSSGAISRSVSNLLWLHLQKSTGKNLCFALYVLVFAGTVILVCFSLAQGFENTIILEVSVRPIVHYGLRNVERGGSSALIYSPNSLTQHRIHDAFEQQISSIPYHQVSFCAGAWKSPQGAHTRMVCKPNSCFLFHSASELNHLGPIHTGRGTPCNTRKQIMAHTAVNGSVHTALQATSKDLQANLHANLLTRPV